MTLVVDGLKIMQDALEEKEKETSFSMLFLSLKRNTTIYRLSLTSAFSIAECLFFIRERKHPSPMYGFSCWSSAASLNSCDQRNYLDVELFVQRSDRLGHEDQWHSLDSWCFQKYKLLNKKTIVGIFPDAYESVVDFSIVQGWIGFLCQALFLQVFVHFMKRFFAQDLHRSPEQNERFN